MRMESLDEKDIRREILAKNRPDDSGLSGGAGGGSGKSSRASRDRLRTGKENP